MNIAPRLKKIREIRGWKQAAVADAMKTTQQSYSSLEQGIKIAKIETLQRFCDVMQVKLYFLLAEDVPVTEETIVNYGNKNLSELIADCQRMELKLEVFNSILTANEQPSAIQNILRSGMRVA